MTGALLLSIYVAGVVGVVVLDGLFGWWSDTHAWDEEGSILTVAAAWPIVALLLACVAPIVALAALHEKLSEGRQGPEDAP